MGEQEKRAAASSLLPACIRLSVRSDPLLAAEAVAEAEAEAVAEREDPDSSACLHMHAVTMIVRLI
jgi:hypothetical protein